MPTPISEQDQPLRVADEEEAGIGGRAASRQTMCVRALPMRLLSQGSSVNAANAATPL